MVLAVLLVHLAVCRDLAVPSLGLGVHLDLTVCLQGVLLLMDLQGLVADLLLIPPPYRRC